MTAPGHSMDRSIRIPLLVFAILAAGGMLFFANAMRRFAITPDFYWLWRGGADIIAHRRLPESDIFSWTLSDQPVVYYQWLFMVVTAAVMELGGLTVLYLAYVAVIAAIYLLIPLAGAVPRRVPAALTIVIAAFGLAIITINMQMRPMLATSAMLLLQFVLLQRLRRERSGLLATAILLLPLYALWANLHNGTVLGLGSLCLFAAGDEVERRRFYVFEPTDAEAEGRPLPLGRYVVLAGTAILGSLINPYGIGLYTHLLQFSSQSILNEGIVELQSANFHLQQFRWFLLLMAGFALLLTRAKRVFAAADLLHLAAFTVATLVCARFVVWAVLFYVLILPRALHHAWTARPDARSQLATMLRDASAATSPAAALFTAMALVGWGLWVALSARPLSDPCDPLRPALAAYDQLRRPADRLFASAEAGSCAIAAPAYPKVFIDTRFDFYGADFTGAAIRTLSLAPDWRSTLDHWRIDTIIVEKNWPLAQALAMDPAYKILFADDTAIVARRPTPAAEN